MAQQLTHPPRPGTRLPSKVAAHGTLARFCEFTVLRRAIQVLPVRESIARADASHANEAVWSRFSCRLPPLSACRLRQFSNFLTYVFTRSWALTDTLSRRVSKLRALTRPSSLLSVFALTQLFGFGARLLHCLTNRDSSFLTSNRPALPAGCEFCLPCALPAS